MNLSRDERDWPFFRKDMRTKSAWLVTWKWTGDHARVEDPIVAVLNYRFGGKTVFDFVERLYATVSYSHTEKLESAINREYNPYRAEFESIEGVPWQGRITCGHNPWLYARMVNNLRLVSNADGIKGLGWEERPSMAFA